VTRVRLLAIGGLAWSGVLLGHLLAYVLAHPAEAERSARLANSGHDSFPLLLISALAGIPAVLSLLAVRVIRGDRSPAFLSIALCLAAIQVPTFLAMEFFERGMSFERMLLEPAVSIGVGIQVLVAFISAVLVRTFVRAVGALTARRSRLLPAEPRARELTPVSHPRARRLDFLISAQHRAPPLSLAS
jgi:hypothetical protein